MERKYHSGEKPEDNLKIKITELSDLMQAVLTTEHFSTSQAKDITEVLLYAEMTGKNTQGVVKLLGTDPIQNVEPQYEAKVIKETKLSALIDGGRNPGILVSRMATEMAIDRCRDTGFAIIGTNNTYSSTGAIGYYANEIANNDFIGIVMSGSPKGVAPYGSIDPLFGTNPIAFGLPTENDPLIFDMATAAITWYGLVRAKALGEELPDGVAIDDEGNSTRDPEKAMKGAILPFDNNPKTSGLSMMIEMLTGPLVDATLPDPTGKYYCGNLFMAIDPDLFIGRESFKRNSSLLIDKIKTSRTHKDFQSVAIPGERSMRVKREAEEGGEIEIEGKLFRDMLNLIKN